MLFLGNAGLWVLALVPAIILIVSLGLADSLVSVAPGSNPLLQNPGLFFPIVIAALIPLTFVGPFIRYRSWRFFIRHMEASGEVYLLTLTQSPTSDLKQGEGLLDAFDMGAI